MTNADSKPEPSVTNGKCGEENRWQEAGSTSDQRLVARVEFTEEAVHGAVYIAIRQEGALDNGPFGVAQMEMGSGNFRQFVFIGTDHFSKAKTAGLHNTIDDCRIRHCCLQKEVCNSQGR
jgi:hypothetical protein